MSVLAQLAQQNAQKKAQSNEAQQNEAQQNEALYLSLNFTLVELFERQQSATDSAERELYRLAMTLAD